MTRGADQAVATRGACPKCGEVHERCTGHNVSGKPCGRFPTNGVTVCMKHGAGAPQVKAAAARNVVIARAEAAVMALDPDARSGDWIDALERVLARQEAMEDYLRRQVEKVQPESWRQLDAKDAEQLHALVDAYRVALRDLRDTADKIGRLDLDAVRIRIDAQRKEHIVASMRKGLDAYRSEAGVSDEAHARGLAAMSKAMSA